MRVVTRRTGLSADLLRAWERRHEVVKPSRSEGGRRLYSDQDIERLRLLYRATLAGRNIGQVAELSMRALALLVQKDVEADAVAERPGHGPPASVFIPPRSVSDYLRDCILALERLDAATLDAMARRAAVALPFGALLDGLVVPLLERAGTGWREGSLHPVHEHLASVVLRRLLDRAIESAVSHHEASNVVVATPAGQIHEFGALLVAATAAVEGWKVTYLGGDLPAEDIAEAALRTRPWAVVLSVVFPAGDPMLADELRRLRTTLPKTVSLVVGGAASSAYKDVLEEIGAVRLGSLEEFRAQLRTIRETPRRIPRRNGRSRADPSSPGTRPRPSR
jgi:DNA-binding transcriptional MerR regulator/methylmalonyl-CoA mutase cobalamin-binding subunit